MSVENFIGDILDGNFSNALKRLEDWWSSNLQPELKALISKFSTDGGQLVWSTGTTVLAAVAAGQSVSDAAAAAWETIKDQVPGMVLADLEDAIGIQKRATTTAAN